MEVPWLQALVRRVAARCGWMAGARPPGVLGLQPGWNRQGCSLLRVGVRWPHLDSAEHADRDETQHVLRPECHLRAKQSDGRAEPGPPPRAAAAAVVVSWPPRADVPVVTVGITGCATRHRLRQWGRRWGWGRAVGVGKPPRAVVPGRARAMREV